MTFPSFKRVSLISQSPGHDDIDRQEIVPFFGKLKRPVPCLMGALHGRHAGIRLDLQGGVFFAFLGKNLDLHDHRAQLGLLVEAVYEVIVISNRDLFARPRH